MGSENAPLTRKQRLDLAMANIKQSLSEAPPHQKIMGVILVGLLGTLFVVFATIFASKPDDEDPETAQSYVTSLSVNDDQKVGGVLRNSNALVTEEIVSAEKERVTEQAKAGKSAFQALNPNSDDDVFSRYEQERNKKKQERQKKSTILTPKDFVNRGLSKDENGKGGSASSGDKKILPGTAGKFNRTELSEDPYVGMTEERYIRELSTERSDMEKKLQEAIENSKSLIATSQVALSPYETEEDKQDSNSVGGGVSGGNNSNGSLSDGKTTPPILLKPGDEIIATAKFPVDSRTTKKFVLVGVSPEPFRDARITCTYSYSGKYLIPICSQILIDGKQGKMEAVAMNPRTLSGIVDQDVDNSSVMKNLAFIGTQMLSQIGVAKLEQGKTVTQTDTTVVEENNTSDRDIVIAGLATGLGALSGAAQQYYASEAVRTIKAGTSIMLVQTAPMPDWWGITEQEYEW